MRRRNPTDPWAESGPGGPRASATGGALSGDLHFGPGEHLHGEDERPLLRRMQRPNADDLAGDLLPMVVADRERDGILPGLSGHGMPDDAFHPQRRETGRRA